MRIVASITAGLTVYFMVLTVTAQDVPGNSVNGRRIYEESCARCHGLTGAGDGSDAGRMVVRPADLRSMGLLLKSDLELMRSIAYGVAFSPMHEWRDQMSNQEMWDVVRYLRTLAIPQGQPISARQDDQPDSVVRQEPTPSERRIPLHLPAPLREGLRLTMREHLEALRAIAAALAIEDFDRAAVVAHEELGFPKHHQAMQREQGTSFPQKYEELAMAHHQAAEDLASVIPSKDLKRILSQLDTTMTACIRCHRAFNLGQ